jgi:cellulose synthase/poly-beta-1,6-N-acetylglucosamine synthase-like glycosyltransferase
VIVVNDASTDSTAGVLAALGGHYPHLRVVTIGVQETRTFPGKKFALSRGLAAASHEWIVCTDADCKPASDAWLHYMAAPLIAGKEIVAGYGGYERTQSVLNTFIRYETVHTFLQYYSFNRAGMPYMAVGRNLAATREVFLKAQGHPAWNLLPSGDDDLLVQLCADRTNMAVVAHPGSFTWSKGQEDLTKYLRQKQRHVSTGKYYKPWTKVALGLYATANELWWILLIILLAKGAPGMPLLILFVPWLFLVITFQQGGSFLRERTTVLGWMVFSFCWMLYDAVLAPYILWKSKQRWK